MCARKVGTAVVALMLAFPVLAQNRVNKADRNTTIQVSYGTVIDVESVKVKSDAGKNAVVGGVVGLAVSHGKSSHDRQKSAAAGALLGALLTKHAEGKHKASAYTVRRTNGATIKIIMDHADVRPGDCVSIEEGRTSNLRRVADILCQGTSFHSDPLIVESQASEADECHMAKELVLKAATDEEFERASMKVAILCH